MQQPHRGKDPLQSTGGTQNPEYPVISEGLGFKPLKNFLLLI